MRNLHVVIPTLGRASCASVAAEALSREYRLARLTIVVQGGVVDPAIGGEAARRGVELGVVVLPGPIGPARARHRGACEGHEEFVGFLDDDITFDRGSLSDLVERCEQGGLGGASGVLHTPETSRTARVLKAMLFRSIFRDPRALAARASRPVPSRLLSGGMTVYRRSAYDLAVGTGAALPDGGCGEDVELSYTVSRHAALAIDPTVRVHNLTRQLSVGPTDPTARAMRRLDRYRSFATRHATGRADWAAYLTVLIGVLARGLAEGAGLTFVRATWVEMVRALIGARRGTSPGPLPGAPTAHPEPATPSA